MQQRKLSSSEPSLHCTAAAPTGTAAPCSQPRGLSQAVRAVSSGSARSVGATSGRICFDQLHTNQLQCRSFSLQAPQEGGAVTFTTFHGKSVAKRGQTKPLNQRRNTVYSPLLVTAGQEEVDMEEGAMHSQLLWVLSTIGALAVFRPMCLSCAKLLLPGVLLRSLIKKTKQNNRKPHKKQNKLNKYCSKRSQRRASLWYNSCVSLWREP